MQKIIYSITKVKNEEKGNDGLPKKSTIPMTKFKPKKIAACK